MKTCKDCKHYEETNEYSGWICNKELDDGEDDWEQWTTFVDSLRDSSERVNYANQCQNYNPKP